MTRKPISMPTDCESPARTEPRVNNANDAWTRIFLLTRSESLPQMGVVAVDARRVAVTTHVYWPCVPCRSVMMTGSALDTIVDERNATNIPRSRPTSASSFCRWVIGAPAAEVTSRVAA